MSRIKRTGDYINALCASRDEMKSVLGKKLKQQYGKWSKSLALHDFLQFIDLVRENKSKIGVPQFFGKFRAYAFEEYLYKLIAAKLRIPSSLQLFWGEKCLIWRDDEKSYAMEFDVSVGKKTEDLVEPTVVFEAKVELDSSRLKSALGSFAILKQWNPRVKCLLVYLFRDVDPALFKLTERWVDCIFQFSPEENALACFFEFINNSLREC